PDWSTGEPDFDNPKISVNARLFDDFDLDNVEVVVIDGKNLW
ncbi:MAG: GFA family protein, partial [Mesorhizobium sp.]